LKALHEEYKEFQEHTKALRNSIAESEKEYKELTKLRQKCVDMVSCCERKFKISFAKLPFLGYCPCRNIKQSTSKVRKDSQSAARRHKWLAA
jgi:hypothetical protein